MRLFGIVVVTVGILGTTARAVADDPVGVLKVEQKKAKEKAKHEFLPYAPREGDLVFYDDRNPVWTALFAYAGTGPPLHMGIVVKKSNRRLAILEAGPDDTVRVELLDLDKRLPQFHKDFDGPITIRRCKRALGDAESKALTKFAEAQAGKRYAIGRLLLQGTSLRTRGPLREMVLGSTQLDRDSWICSELSVAAGTVAKLFDPKVVYANVAYPRDLVNNERYKLDATWHDAALWLPKRP